MTDTPDSTPLPDNVVPHPRGRDGRLTTPDGEELQVRTFERGKDAALVVVVDSDTHQAAERLESVVLEYNSGRGLVTLRGEAVFEDHALIRFQAQVEPEVTQRREFVRVSAPAEIRLAGEQESADERVHAVDVSGGGMLVSGADTLQVGDPVRFTLQLAAGEPALEGIARVVRIEADGKRGLSFEGLAESDRERLIRYVFECMRKARAKTRGDHL